MDSIEYGWSGPRVAIHPLMVSVMGLAGDVARMGLARAMARTSAQLPVVASEAGGSAQRVTGVPKAPKPLFLESKRQRDPVRPPDVDLVYRKI